MKVLHLNTDDVKGGAARAAYRLHRGLLGLGCDSRMLVLHRHGDDATVQRFVPPKTLAARLRRLLRAVQIWGGFARYRRSHPAGYELFSDDRTPYGPDLARRLPAGAVVHLHWITGFVDYRGFFPTVPRRSPVVWTLHDMNAFTGGCHYDMGCGRYDHGCGRCPQLGSGRENDLSRRIWERKRELFRRLAPDRLHLVAPSRWMADEIGRSALLGRFPVTITPYGVDTETFAPRGRRESRRALDLPGDARIVLFLAASTANPRKGFALLRQAMPALAETFEDLFVLSAGSGHPALEVGVPHLHLGNIEDDRRLSQVYSAADVFVIPSLQDNLPNTVLEAMACGTPVAGFAVGGIPDMVRPGVTGRLAEPEDPASLAEAIAALLWDPAEREEMGAACRRVVLDEYTLELQARRCSELYRQVAAAPPGRSTNRS
jgi:glycosyltransferase involved in cell wall biosynthesis